MRTRINRKLRGRAVALGLLALVLAGSLLSAGCQKVPLEEDYLADYESLVAATPEDFQVSVAGSIAGWDDREPVLTLLLKVTNPNDFPRAFRSIRVELYGAEGRQLGFRSWTTQRSPFILGAGSSIPLAIEFGGIEAWQTARASFSGLTSPGYDEVHQGLVAVTTEPLPDGDELAASVTVQNGGSVTATDVTVLVGGYNSSGELVAWAVGQQQWRNLGAGSTATFTTDPFLGDISQVTTVKAFLSAYNG
jgi:hypothetical protein